MVLLPFDPYTICKWLLSLDLDHSNDYLLSKWRVEDISKETVTPSTEPLPTDPQYLKDFMSWSKNRMLA